MTEDYDSDRGPATLMMNIGRVAKVLALLGFLLPWVTVSCSTRRLGQASGLQLATGDVTILDPAIGPGGLVPVQDYLENAFRGDLFVVAAAALILLGLALTFLRPRRRSALAGMIAALAALGCLLFEFLVRIPASWQDSAHNAALARAGTSAISPGMQRELDAMLDRISIHVGSGFWITSAALVAAALFLAAAFWQPRRT